MAAGKVYKRRSGNWAIDYCCHGRRVREVIGPDKKLAEAVLHKRLTEIVENKHLDIRRTKEIKFKDFATIYMETHAKPNKRSWKSSDANSLKKLVPYFGDQLLAEITADQIERYKIARSKEIAPSSVNRELACLKTMYFRAIDWNYALVNPASKVKLFQEKNHRTRYLDKEELEQLLTFCSSGLKAVVLTAIYTGMRKGEIERLKWTDINFQQDFITIHITKNGESRIIPMSQKLKELLMSISKHPQSALVFSSRSGKSYNFRKVYDIALKKAGLKGVVFHTLRHSYASHLAMAGVDLNVIRELLGHKDLSMTLRYSHLSADHKKRAVQLLDQKLEFNDTKLSPNVFHEESAENLSQVTSLKSIS